ncbi:MAG TPA: hypothetical protein EYP85_16820 [Armatimonadetes bacterium]|nr:hypothetical protein [Armatimonadota bacterium]
MLTLKADRVEIYADVHERESGIIEILRDQYRAQVFVTRLEVGDYLLSERVGVERKSVFDLVDSLKGKRIFHQIQDLRENFARPLLIVEGGNLYAAGRTFSGTIRRLLAWIVVGQGVPVLHTQNSQDTAAFLMTIARQEQQGLDFEVSLRGERRARTPAEQQLRVLEGFPGVGPRLAATLLRHFGSLESVLQASEEELLAVPGLGPERASQIRYLLTTPFSDHDTHR